MLPDPSSSARILAAAHEYAARGFPVHPLYGIREDGSCECVKPGEACKSKSSGKHPRLVDWKEQATADIEVINSWWRRWPVSNLGLATGARSGIVVIETDDANAAARFADLTGGVSHVGPVAASGSGKGTHYYFAHPGRYVKTASHIFGDGVGIDIRGDGGNVVMPPSHHVSGGRYSWLQSIDCTLPPLPDWLPPSVFKDGRVIDFTTREVLSGDAGHHAAEKLLGMAISKVVSGEMGRDDGGAWLAMQLRDSRVEIGIAETAILEFCDAVQNFGDHEYAPDKALLTLSSIYGTPAREPPHPPKLTAEGTPKVELSDKGNADIFLSLHGDDVRWCPEMNQWHVLDRSNGLWLPDKDMTIRRLAGEVATTHYRALPGIQNDKERNERYQWARSSGMTGHINATLTEAQPGVVLHTSDIDADPMVMGTPRGVLSLRDMTLHEPGPGIYVSRSTAVPYIVKAFSADWVTFLDMIIPDLELRADIFNALAYSVTGYPKEHLFFVHGGTRTGKSTFMRAITNALGDYATYAQASTFASAWRVEQGRSREDVVALVGRRVVVVSEVERELHLSSQMVKQLTGNEPISARANYGKQFTFLPTFALWFLVNDLPHLPVDDDAVWERVHVFNFNQYIDANVRSERLRDRTTDPAIVGPAIMHMIMEAFERLQANGGQLQLGRAVQRLTQEYRTDIDPLEPFLADCCVLNPDEEDSFKNVKSAYKRWANQSNVRFAYSDKRLGQNLARKGCEPFLGGPRRDERWYRGISVRPDAFGFSLDVR